MKLRNKKTGEIVGFRYLQSDHVAPLVLTTYENDKPEMYSYNSLAELNEEWEDVPEEPKGYWWISPVHTDAVHCVEDVKDEMDKYNKEIGNYFESPEEAEKAVEKLKAWKRLKDARFEFGTIKYNLDEESSSTIAYDGIITIKGMAYEDFVEDLDLLFGGEE